MIIKALIAKKIVTVAVVLGTAAADGAMTRRANARGAGEMNPVIRPFASSWKAIPAVETDAVLASILLIEKPKSRFTRALVPYVITEHAAGAIMSSRAHGIVAPVSCWRSGKDGSGFTCN